MNETPLARVLSDERLNAGLAWALTAGVAALAVGSLLEGEPLSAGFAAVVVALAVVPPVGFRHPRAMLPWEVLALASLPVLARTVVVLSGLGTGRIATYVAVAAVALIVAVELHVFTAVRMSPGFAVVFVVLTTMAAAGVWAVSRWAADVLLGTGFLLRPGVEEATVERRLMLDFLASTVAGLGGGAVFQLYVRRQAPLDERIVGADADAGLGEVP
ncbi:hypothetical protein BRC99_01940 [Halobacteriales archaeon QS_7_69_60]|nr:MAG: hypothetical protein BRC88_10190 [Halobacteriales archaeon QS_4_69_225]PSQ14945.1 MAG: hypothetical protein BRC99_01940 [Halobacteriales archaeon QS_7_69_60]